MYATGTLLDEVAYIAAVLGWSLDDALDLEHPDREHFVAVARSFVESADPVDGTEEG